MFRIIVVAIFAVSIVALTGCDDEEDNRASSEANAAQVQNLQDSVTNLGTVASISTDSTSATSAQGTLGSLYTSYDSFVQNTMAADAAEGAQVVQQAEALYCSSGSAEWTETGVTYDACDGLTGSIEWSGDTYTIDITYDFGAGYMTGYSGSFTYSGSLTITDTEIDGGLDMAYQINMDSMGYQVAYDSDYSISYNAVGLDAAGCPESGSLDMQGSWGYEAAGYSGNESFDITAEFNACGDVTILS